jgi:stage V sporulation protein SpoVS
MPTDLRVLAMQDMPSLKVSGESKPQSVARAIQHVMRESPSQLPPSVTAIGPAAINQAIKAIAIARRQVHSEGTLAEEVRSPHRTARPTPATFLINLAKCFIVSRLARIGQHDAARANPLTGSPFALVRARQLTVKPVFEAGLREGSNVALVLSKGTARLPDVPADDESSLSAKPTTDAFKLAGAIAGRMREGERASILVKGAVPVLIAVKAIAKAQEYVAADGMSLAFTAALVDKENKALRDAPTSTFTQLCILKLPAAAEAA